MEPITEELKGAEIIMHSLLHEGVDILFGYPGGAIMPVYDALYDHADRLHHVLARHEQGAIHAAQGYARASGKVGVVIATSGPGATNLLTGLADAMMDSTPIVCITGQVAAHLLGTDAFQEVDVVNVSSPVTKWNIQITDPKHIAQAIAEAFYIARSGRTGPVLVDITKNAQVEKAPYQIQYKKCEKISTYRPVPKVNPVIIEKAATCINQAKRPYILAGQGILISGAQEVLVDFSEKTGIPVACTLLGLGGFPATHPNYVGYLGMHGNYAPNVNTNECDVLIAIGMRFDDRVTGDINSYAKQAKIIHIDIDKAELDKIIKTDIALHADAKEALQKLLPLCEAKTHSHWIDSFKQLDKKEKEKVRLPKEMPEDGIVTMAETILLLDKLTQSNAIIVSDVGQHQMVTARYYKYINPRSLITSGGAGTMGFSLPAAIGAKLAIPQKTVISISGDGGIQMNIQELGTIMQSNVGVKIIVLNNQFLGMVRQWQELFFDKRYSFTELINPDFIKIAEGYSIPAQRVETRQDLLPALQTMLSTPGPYFLEIIVQKKENVFPMVPSGAGVSDILLELPSLKKS